MVSKNQQLSVAKSFIVSLFKKDDSPPTIPVKQIQHLFEQEHPEIESQYFHKALAYSNEIDINKVNSIRVCSLVTEQMQEERKKLVRNFVVTLLSSDNAPLRISIESIHDNCKRHFSWFKDSFTIKKTLKKCSSLACENDKYSLSAEHKKNSISVSQTAKSFPSDDVTSDSTESRKKKKKSTNPSVPVINKIPDKETKQKSQVSSSIEIGDTSPFVTVTNKIPESNLTSQLSTSSLSEASTSNSESTGSKKKKKKKKKKSSPILQTNTIPDIVYAESETIKAPLATSIPGNTKTKKVIPIPIPIPTIQPVVIQNATQNNIVTEVLQVDNQLNTLLDVFPIDIRTKIVDICGSDASSLIEIAMDKDRPYELYFYNNHRQAYYSKEFIVKQEHLEHVVTQIQFGSDKRSGIEGTLHRISSMHNREGRIVGLTMRVGRSVEGAASVIHDILQKGESVLLLGSPGSGKTTIIRDISRIVAETSRVIIVDTSCEIGGFGDVPHSAVGRARRMQVGDIRNQQEVMIQAVQNHTPDVIVIDEIGTKQEVNTARTIAQRGVVLYASAHGSMQSIMKNPVLNDLLGGVDSVLISDNVAKQYNGEKFRLHIKDTPLFEVVIEISDDNEREWKVYRNLKDTIMKILDGKVYQREIRTINCGTITSMIEDVDPLCH
jgi:stage III sporulation protein SpoIIIAA